MKVRPRGSISIEMIVFLPLLFVIFFQHVYWLKTRLKLLQEVSSKRWTYDGGLKWARP